jgi:glycosyltransferase involved in cell wall biosynthesis
MKTILLITHSSSLTGGGEDDFQKLLLYFKDKYKIFTIFPKGPRSPNIKKYSEKYLEITGSVFPFTKFDLIGYLKFIKHNYRKAFEVFSFLKKNKNIDLCFVNSSVCFLEVLPLIYFKIPYILSVKENIHPKFIRKLIFLIYKYSAEKIIAISKFLKDAITDITKREDIEILYSTINEDEFEEVRKDYENKVNKNEAGKFKILNIGSVQKLKSQHVLLEAAKMVKNVDFKVEFAGSISSPVYFKYLEKQMIENKDYRDKILYIGELRKDELIKKIIDSDCVVITSREEGQSLVLLESLFLGKPVITTKVGIVDEIIKNGENGLIYEYGNSVMLSKLLTKLITDKVLYKKLQINCRNTYFNNFNSEVMIKRFENIFSGILDRKN